MVEGDDLVGCMTIDYMGGRSNGEDYVINNGENLLAETQSPHQDFDVGDRGVGHDYLTTTGSRH